MKRPAVEVVIIKGGRHVCKCHGKSIRWIVRKGGDFDSREYVHCEHPENYIEYGDGYIPDYCERCGWNTG